VANAWPLKVPVLVQYDVLGEPGLSDAFLKGDFRLEIRLELGSLFLRFELKEARCPILKEASKIGRLLQLMLTRHHPQENKDRQGTLTSSRQSLKRSSL
jgi:hypothetical protein